MNNTETKQTRCKACKQYKERTVENFAQANLTADGLSNTCIHCQLAKQKAKAAEYKAKAFERAKEKRLNAPSVGSVKEVRQKINHFSKKGKIAHDELTQVKKQIRNEAFDMDNRFCKGCGRGDVGLDCSHILSVKQRPDLANDKHNLNLLCRGCHQKHESFDIKLMLELRCFESDMRYIYAHDETKFNKVLFKLLDYFEKTSDKKAEKMLKVLEKEENY